MDTIVIKGGATLSGTVSTGGAKNAALPLLFATLLADGEYRFRNVPRLRDIDSTLLLLEHLGTRVDRSDIDTCPGFIAVVAPLAPARSAVSFR